MMIQRRISLISCAISFLALLVSIVAHWFGCIFISNVFIGIFGSSLLSTAVAFISYYGERSRALYALYSGCFDFMESLNGNLRLDDEVPFMEVKNNLSAMKISYMKDVYANVNQLGALSHSSKLYKLVMNVWGSAKDVYMLVYEDYDKIMQFMLKDISLEEFKAYRFRYVSDESIASIKKLQQALDDLLANRDFYGEKKKHNVEDKDNAN